MSSIDEENEIFDVAWKLYHSTPFSIKDCTIAVRKCGLGKEEQEYIDYLKLHHS